MNITTPTSIAESDAFASVLMAHINAAVDLNGYSGPEGADYAAREHALQETHAALVGIVNSHTAQQVSLALQNAAPLTKGQ